MGGRRAREQRERGGGEEQRGRAEQRGSVGEGGREGERVDKIT